MVFVEENSNVLKSIMSEQALFNICNLLRLIVHAWQENTQIWHRIVAYENENWKEAEWTERHFKLSVHVLFTRKQTLYLFGGVASKVLGFKEHLTM